MYSVCNYSIWFLMYFVKIFQSYVCYKSREEMTNIMFIMKVFVGLLDVLVTNTSQVV